MRWTEQPTPKDAETRTIKRFLFLPLCIGNEYRWLETASIKQDYFFEFNAPVGVNGWNNSAWID